jgi:hypothetical protein
MMEIAKYQTPAYRCIIKTNTYCDSYNYIQHLVAAAAQDFPEKDFDDGDVVIKIYSDGLWKGMMGLEFNAGHYHPSYRTIERLPATYN